MSFPGIQHLEQQILDRLHLKRYVLVLVVSRPTVARPSGDLGRAARKAVVFILYQQDVVRLAASRFAPCWKRNANRDIGVLTLTANVPILVGWHDSDHPGQAVPAPIL